MTKIMARTIQRSLDRKEYYSSILSSFHTLVPLACDVFELEHVIAAVNERYSGTAHTVDPHCRRPRWLAAAFRCVITITIVMIDRKHGISQEVVVDECITIAVLVRALCLQCLEGEA